MPSNPSLGFAAPRAEARARLSLTATAIISQMGQCHRPFLANVSRASVSGWRNRTALCSLHERPRFGALCGASTALQLQLWLLEHLWFK